MHELSALQAECERRLDLVLTQLSTTLVERQVIGEKETYVKGRIRGTDLDVFIYEDGEAQIQGPGVDERFEIADYPQRRIEGLWEAFEESVRQRIRQSGDTDRDLA